MGEAGVGHHHANFTIKRAEAKGNRTTCQIHTHLPLSVPSSHNGSEWRLFIHFLVQLITKI